MSVQVLDISDRVVTWVPTSRSDHVAVQDADADTLEAFDYWVSAYRIAGDTELTEVGQSRPDWLSATLTQSVSNGVTNGTVTFELDEKEVPADVAELRVGMSVSDGQATTTDAVLYSIQTDPSVGDNPQAAVGHPTGQRGEVYFITEDDTNIIAPGRTLRRVEVVETAAELAAAKEGGGGATFQSIFNEWDRFSHLQSDVDVDPVPPDDIPLADLFSYNQASDAINQPSNTDPAVGLFSNRVYETYTHKATLSSTSVDDDRVGVVIAFEAVDPGVDERTLSVVVQPSDGGVGTPGFEAPPDENQPPVLRVVYNLSQDSRQTLYKETDFFNSSPLSWQDAGSGIGVQVDRDGDDITVTASQWGSPGTLDPASEITFSLEDHPETQVFRGGSPYGYLTASQPDSTFSDRSFSEAHRLIFDLSGGLGNEKVHGFVGGSWQVLSGVDFFEEAGVGRLLYNERTGKGFYVGPPTVGVQRVWTEHYDIGDYIESVGSNDADTLFGTLVRHPVQLLGGAAKASAAPGSNLVLNVYKNGTQAASVTIQSGSTTSTSSSFPLTFQRGDTLRIEKTGGNGAADVFYMIEGVSHAA